MGAIGLVFKLKSALRFPDSSKTIIQLYSFPVLADIRPSTYVCLFLTTIFVGFFFLHLIYCIYILDYGIDLPPRPVLKVNYKVEDACTGDEFPVSGEFVSGLHHRSWIVQIRELKERRRNELENRRAR